MTEHFPIPGPPPAPRLGTPAAARWRDASRLPGTARAQPRRAEDYLPGTALVAIKSTSLTLGQPLLLTGEPGVGKTCLAANVAKRTRARHR